MWTWPLKSPADYLCTNCCSSWLCFVIFPPSFRGSLWKPGPFCRPGCFYGYFPQWPPRHGCKCALLTDDFFPAGPGSIDNFHGLAVFIDTYPNDEASYVSSKNSVYVYMACIYFIDFFLPGHFCGTDHEIPSFGFVLFYNLSGD